MDLIRITFILTLTIAVESNMCWGLLQPKTEVVATESMSLNDFETMLQLLMSNAELINQLIGRVGLLEIRDKSQLERIQSLETLVENQQLEIKQLQTEGIIREKSLQKRIQTLEERYVKNQELQALQLQTELRSLRQRTRRLEYISRRTINDKLQPGNTKLTKKAADIEINDSRISQNRIRRAGSETHVAFTATVSDHNIEHAGFLQIVVFDNVITNVGNAYNSHVGTFIAPVNGIYVFSVILFSPYGTSFHGRMVRNGQLLTMMYLSGTESTGHQTASQTVVLQLNKGDDVCIQTSDPDARIFGYKYTLFSGFLLQ